jgi:sigma-B regulation protein RsbU (phosphoserine phosphatase)
MPAALLMSNLQATIRGQAMLDTSIPECLAHSNSLLFHNTSPEKFATLFFGCLNTNDHTLCYANAGHNFPLLFKRNGEFRTLEEGGMVLGCLDNSEFNQETLQIETGDRLVIYSDGITEALNRADEEFGEARLHQVITAHAKDGAQELVERILDSVQAFAGDVPQMDDMTLVVIQRV